MYGSIPDAGHHHQSAQPAQGGPRPSPDQPTRCWAAWPSRSRSGAPLAGANRRREFVPNPQADLALFNQIRLDKDGAEFDEFEAGNAISKLTYCEVTDCERVGDEYRITLKTPFGDTTHTMKIPTQRDMTVYRRTVVSATDLPHGQEELRYRIEPAVDLYDSVVSKIEGYVDGYKAADVPPHHKSAVVVELVQAIDDLDPQIDPNS